MKSMRLAIIIGAAAICAIIATIIIITSGTGDYGLYITDLSGSTDITTTGKGSAEAKSGVKLSKGDIVTVSTGSTCQITYKSKKNEDQNYIVLEPNTQIVVSDDFNGKSDGEVYLNQGSVLCNTVSDLKADINIVTPNAKFSPAKTVSSVTYNKSADGEICDFYCFMGKLNVQMYDMSGSAVNKADNLFQKKCGEIRINEDGPYFENLNLDFELSKLSKSVLKELIAVAAFVDNFTYTSAELKEAYDNAPDDTVPENVPEVPDSSETTSADSDTVTTEAATETEDSADSSAITTAPPVTSDSSSPDDTTNAQTSEPEQTTASSGSKVYHTVTIIIDGESEIQEVEHGMNAEKPADPDIDGLTFTGWDNSFDNITEDTVINALFDGQGSDMCTVTIVVAGRSTTQSVKYGEAADIPEIINVEGYTFIGWDTDYSAVTTDITVEAILQPNQYTVTFVIGYYSYPTPVLYGETAVPPFVPASDSNGNAFTGWDKPLNNITASTTITAMFYTHQYSNIYN